MAPQVNAPPPQLAQVRVWLPQSVVDWLDAQAGARYETRSQFVRHLIVSYYLYSTRG